MIISYLLHRIGRQHKPTVFNNKKNKYLQKLQPQF